MSAHPYIPYGRQSIDDADIAAVVKVLSSDWLTQGPVIGQFETAVAEHCGAKHGVAVSNGTAALHLACLALGVGPGDYVWTTPNTFVASAYCANHCGASVDFVDIDPRTYNMCPEKLANKLEHAKKQNRLPKLIIPVHFSGQSCVMEKIHALAQHYQIAVLEDGCHAIGGTYQGHKIGDCRFSDAVIFSFHPVKVVTTGEGGMIMTNRDDLDAKLRLLLSHGITRDPEHMTEEAHGPWYYQQIALGFNYRLTDIQAALGFSQLEKLEQFIARRHELVTHYNDLLKDLPVVTPYQHPDNYSAFHLYVIRLKLAEITKTRLAVFSALRKAGIGVNVHYIPVHLQPFYRNHGFKMGDFPEAEKYYAETITLPLFPDLTAENQEYVVARLAEALK